MKIILPLVQLDIFVSIPCLDLRILSVDQICVFLPVYVIKLFIFSGQLIIPAYYHVALNVRLVTFYLKPAVLTKSTICL